MSKEIEYYQQMIQMLKKQMTTTSPDDSTEQYMHYKQQLNDYNKMLLSAMRKKGSLNESENVNWDDE